jgi:RNA polymerase sigma factor (sigma-70 family)
VAQTELELVRRVLGRLPESTREVIQWRYFEDMPVEEIARRLDKSVNATHVMIHRAMKKFREYLQENPYDNRT